jgi:proteasome lid subunit RPN8/RPN11
MSEPILVEEIDTAAPEAPSKICDYIVRHTSGKKLSEEEIFEANHYARELKYPKGALVFNGQTKMTSYTASQTTKNYLSARRWLEAWGF